jgi:hypothetical protein
MVPEFPYPAGKAKLKCSQIVTFPRGFVCLLFTLHTQHYACKEAVYRRISLNVHPTAPATCSQPTC